MIYLVCWWNCPFFQSKWCEKQWAIQRSPHFPTFSHSASFQGQSPIPIHIHTHEECLTHKIKSFILSKYSTVCCNSPTTNPPTNPLLAPAETPSCTTSRRDLCSCPNVFALWPGDDLPRGSDGESDSWWWSHPSPSSTLWWWPLVTDQTRTRMKL